jgi:CheY-like chemotaxis protein
MNTTSTSSPLSFSPLPEEHHRALIVESSPEINQLLIHLFEQPEWGIQFVNGNKEALEVAKTQSFDLIVTSERTTCQEDIELLGRLRLARPHTRLIILTDEFVPGDVLASIRARAFSYFSRPFSTEKLTEIIRASMAEPLWDDGIEVLSATPNWIRIAVRCDLFTANRLIQFYRESSGLPEIETEEVAAAFREILMNAIEHGGHFDPTQYVEIGYVRTSRMVICRVKDPGEGFSADELRHSALSNPPDDPFRHMEEREARGIRPGGFGILMAQKMVDELLFNEQGNEVLLVKHLPKHEEQAAT